MPKVSLITACHNAAAFVAEMIQSVRTQSLSDFEHIVVDDGSTDDSAAIVEQLSRSEPRLRLIRQPNRGVANARNAGFRAASPESAYLLFADADDRLAPRMLEVLVSYLDSHREVGAAFCDFECIDEHGLPTSRPPVGARVIPTPFGVKVLAQSDPLTPLESIVCWAPVMESATLLRRGAYECTPGWCERLGQHGEGVELFSRIALRSDVHYVPEVLYQYRRHPSQSTANGARMRDQERKVNRLLMRLPGVSPADRDRLRDACRFRDFRYSAFVGFNAAQSLVRRGNLLSAARFFAGASRRLITWFVSNPLGYRRPIRGFLAWRLRSAFGCMSRLLPWSQSAPVRRILCIVCGGMGDRLMALPAIRFLRSQYPNAHLCVAWFEGEPAFKEPAIDEEVVFAREDVLSKLRLAARGFDLCFVNTVGVHRVLADVCALLSRAHARIGPRPGGWAGATVYNRPYDNPHEHETVLQARAAGWTGVATQLPYRIPAMPRRESHRNILLHVGSHPGYEMKRWSPTHYRQLICKLMREHEPQIVLVGSPHEKPLMDRVAVGLNARVTVAHSPDQWVPYLAEAALFIGNDSGPAHLAASLEIPTIVIMSATDPARCQPVGEHVRVIYRPCEAGSCYYTGLPCRRCIDSIAPGEVAEIAGEMLSTLPDAVLERAGSAIQRPALC